MTFYLTTNRPSYDARTKHRLLTSILARACIDGMISEEPHQCTDDGTLMPQRRGYLAAILRCESGASLRPLGTLGGFSRTVGIVSWLIAAGAHVNTHSHR